MANEAFALSPISARAAQPSEEDYEAIREAFMETSRGRWFLTEYAKRNRNADTRMVLDAVARIEETLAAQRQPPPPDNKLPQALAAIRKTVEDATATAITAVDKLALEENLAPVRKGMRIIREISWRWREIGADGRICDLIDLQVAAMEAACGQLSAVDARNALNEAFDLIKAQLDRFAEGEASGLSDTAEDAVQAASPAPSHQPPEAATQVEGSAAGEPETAAAIEVIAAEPVTAAEQVAELSEEAADARDEAVLELVAFEMAAPDPSFDELPEPAADAPDIAPELEAAGPAPAAPEMAAPVTLANPIAVPAAEPQAAAPVPPAPALPEPAPECAVEAPQQVSWGSTIIARGIIKTPGAANDPLAPIRRMSQAEKIAFFS